jgi:signal transduction histidine kinase
MRPAVRLPGSLAGRLVAVAALWSVLVMAATGAGLSALFAREVYAGFDREISASVDALAATVSTDPASGALTVPRPLPDPRFSRPLSGRYWHVADVTPEGVQLPGGVRSRSLFDELLAPPPGLAAAALAQPGLTQVADIDREGEPLRLSARIITLPDRSRPTLLLVAADRTETANAARRFTLILAGALAALAAGLMGAIWLQVRLGLAPLTRMGGQLADIRAGRRDKLDEEAPRELAPLARELNALVDHNQAVVERARTHVGNLAHALKTPLSVLRNESAARDDGFGGLVLRQTEAMTRQVDHWLKRAQAAARAEAIGARTEVAPVLDDVVRTLQRLYRPEGVRIDLTEPAPPGLAFRGEREDLEDLLGNLAENACKYGGGLVEIAARALPDQRLELVVEDDGEGLTSDQAISALKRGVRLDESAPGTGLGLSICDELARAYGGSLTLERSGLGGLRARLDLPGID